MGSAPNVSSDRALKSLIAEAVAKTGSHSLRVNDGLYIQISKSGSTSWLFRFQLNGRRREMGLGSYPEISLLKAREKSEDARRNVSLKIDPISLRESENAAAAARQGEALTFRVFAMDYIEAHKPGWSNVKHVQQWTNTLTTYAFPIIGEKPLSSIDTDDLLAILKPIWSVKNETASRVRNRIEAIIASAKARRLFEGENPAAWKGHLDTLLPKRKHAAQREHHAALPYAEMPAFMASTLAHSGSSAQALALVILTACRTSEVLKATWQEIDLESALWTIPASRMKARREHKVPLSTQAVGLLRATPRVDNSLFIFPGRESSKPLSQMAMAMLLRRMKREDITVHGFRSSFRDWAAEETSFPNMVVEMALAHTIGNAVEAAYRRGDLLSKRKELMQAWADYCLNFPQEETGFAGL